MSVKYLKYVNLTSSSKEQPNERTPSPPPRKKSLSPPQDPSTSISSKSTHYTSSSSPTYLEYVQSLEKEVDELESDKAKFSNEYDLLLPPGRVKSDKGAAYCSTYDVDDTPHVKSTDYDDILEDDDEEVEEVFREQVASTSNRPWCVLGNFNVSLHVDEKSTGSFYIDTGMRNFQDFVDAFEVSDVNNTCLRFMHTVCGDGVAGIKRRRRDLYGDGVRNFATTSGRGRLKEDLESSTWQRRHDF
ncbi:hypothetical protein Tco_0656546 [Tanacetum coccineum]|uniref:Uncharacterized protein n=1 Tax=Tanacetum coccineum TaxID=301880 RepID=A0ABQ4X9H9_9ASTR